jgi:plastocyanin
MPRPSLPLLAVALLAACSGGDGKSGPTSPTPTLSTVAITGGNSVVAGQTLQLTASPKDQNGNAIVATIAWSSSATSVATVNTSGLVTGVSAGVAVITASSGSVSSTVSVTVTAAGGGFPLSADVNMPGNIFSPFSVEIAKGGSVNYVFPSDAHNVIFDNVAGKPADILVTSSRTVARTFSAAGTFTYSCTVHPGMVGQVVVH